MAYSGGKFRGAIEVADRNLDQLEIETGLLGDGGPVGEQATRQGSANDPPAKNADANFHKAGDGTEASRRAVSGGR